MRHLSVLLIFGTTSASIPSQGEAVGNDTCMCAYTSGNQASCCASSNGAGKGTGSFCGNWFVNHSCGGTTPLCCTSDFSAQCCKASSSCSPQCGFSSPVGNNTCGCIDGEPSEAASEYNTEMALAYAALTQASMCGPVEPLKNWTCEACRKAGFDLIPGSMRFVTKDGLGANSTFALVAGLKGHDGSPLGCAVAIRGSKNLLDVLTDASFWQQSTTLKDCDGCLVHSGFYERWKEKLRPGILGALEGAGCHAGTGGRVFITGHSMGAAISQLAMYDLSKRGYAVNQSYNFESPRVGNLAFAQAFEAAFDRTVPAFRVTHAEDPVPHIPPTLPGVMTYKHAGPEAYYFPNYPAYSLGHIFCAQAEDEHCSARYGLGQTVIHGSDHCTSPLVPSKNICNCPLQRT